MQIGKLHVGFLKKEKEIKAPPTKDIAWSKSQLYAGLRIPDYNPDDLITRKGFGIYKKMMLDEQVKAAAIFRRDSTTGREWDFQYDEVPNLSEKEQELRKGLMYEIIKCMPSSFKKKLDGIMSSIYNGFSMTEKVYGDIEYEGKTWIGLKTLRTKPFDSFYFNVDEYGNLIDVVQEFDGRQQKIDISRFIHHVQNEDVNEYYGKSELRECYRSYFSKDIIIRFHNIHLERHASGFLTITHNPNEMSGVTVGTPEYEEIQNILRNLSASTGLFLPPGLKAELMIPGNTDAYERAIAMHDKSIAKGLLMPNLLGFSEQGPNGSRALGDTQLEAFMWILDAESKALEETINEQLIRPLNLYNFGDELYPRFTFRPLSQAMIYKLVEAWSRLTGVKAVVNTAKDENFFRDILKVPKRTEDDEKLSDELNPNVDENGDWVTPPTPGAVPPKDKGKGAEKETGEKVKSPAEKDGEDMTVVGHGKVTVDYAALKKGFSRAQRRVDFAAIDRRSEVIQWQGVNSLSETFINLTKELVDQVNVNILSDPKLVTSMKVPNRFRTDIRTAITKAMREGWSLGVDNGRREVDSAKKGQMFSRDQFYKFTALGEIAAQWLESQAFTVAGNLTQDALKTIQQTIMNGIKLGQHERVIQQNIYEAMVSGGFVTAEDIERAAVEAFPDILKRIEDPQAKLNATAARINTVIRTNVFTAINEARMNYFTDPDLGGFVTALQYSAILDNRTTDICNSLDDTVLPLTSQEWETLRPPNHFNCRSILVPVTTLDADIPVQSNAPSVDIPAGFK